MIKKWTDRFFRKREVMAEPDVYIVSYPKSGRTWLRFMLCHYLCEKYNLAQGANLYFEEVTSSAGVSQTKFTHDQSAMVDGFNYRSLEFDEKRYRDKRVLFLGRDIKDTLVSAYHQATKRINVFDGSMSEFLRDERFGVQKIVQFYRLWLENKSVPEAFSFLSYEDMHQDPSSALRSALAYIGERDIDDSAVLNSIHHGQFDNMRKIELDKESKSSVIKPRDISSQDSFKTRKGVIGSYLEELSPEDILYVDEIMNDFNLMAFEGSLSSYISKPSTRQGKVL